MAAWLRSRSGGGGVSTNAYGDDVDSGVDTAEYRHTDLLHSDVHLQQQFSGANPSSYSSTVELREFPHHQTRTPTADADHASATSRTGAVEFTPDEDTDEAAGHHFNRQYQPQHRHRYLQTDSNGRISSPAGWRGLFANPMVRYRGAVSVRSEKDVGLMTESIIMRTRHIPLTIGDAAAGRAGPGHRHRWGAVRGDCLPRVQGAAEGHNDAALLQRRLRRQDEQARGRSYPRRPVRFCPGPQLPPSGK